MAYKNHKELFMFGTRGRKSTRIMRVCGGAFGPRKGIAKVPVGLATRYSQRLTLAAWRPIESGDL